MTSVSSSQPRAAMVARTRPQASSMSSFITWTLALTSRIWSSVRRDGTKVAGPPSMLDERALPVAEPVRRLGRQDLADGVVAPGVAGREVEVLPGDAAELGGRAGPTGGAGRGTTSSRTTAVRVGGAGVDVGGQGAASRPCMSATQSVWYHSRGIGLFFVSGAPVSPPGAACSRPAKLCRCSGWCSRASARSARSGGRPRRPRAWPARSARSRATGRCRRGRGAAFSSKRRSGSKPGSKWALPSSAVR